MATIKQQRLVKVLSENSRLPLGKAMIQAGYSPVTATRPQHATRSQGFQDLMAEVLSDDLLRRKHLELLQAKKVVSARFTSKEADESTDDFIEVEDYPTQVKALDMGYKIRNLYPDAKVDVNFSQNWLKLQEEYK